MSLLNYAEPITEGLLLLDFTRIFLVSEYLLICKEVLESISEPLSKEWPMANGQCGTVFLELCIRVS